MNATINPKTNRGVTCGVLFEKVWRQVIETVKDPLLLFASGHVCGQSEKIYLGACSAAMFRPSTEEGYRGLLETVEICSMVYGLRIRVLFPDDPTRREIWIFRPDSWNLIVSLEYEEYNSPSWHILRGLLCGVPLESIDAEFHLRSGFSEPCDRQ